MYGLVKEVPGKAQAHVQRIHGHVWNQEHVASPSIEMSHIDVETAMFQMEVGIGIDYGIVANSYSGVIGVLYGKHSYGTKIVRCMV